MLSQPPPPPSLVDTQPPAWLVWGCATWVKIGELKGAGEATKAEIAGLDGPAPPGDTWDWGWSQAPPRSAAVEARTPLDLLWGQSLQMRN